MNIGITEFIVIGVVALFVLGPDKLPMYAKKLGQGLNALKDTSSTLASDIRENITEPLQEVVEPLQEITQPLQDLKKPLDEATKTFKEITHPVKKKPAAKPVAAAVEQVTEDTVKAASLEAAEVVVNGQVEANGQVDADTTAEGEIKTDSALPNEAITNIEAETEPVSETAAAQTAVKVSSGAEADLQFDEDVLKTAQAADAALSEDAVVEQAKTM